MKVYAENHYSAALLTDLETNKTFLAQSESDQNSILGEDWKEGVFEISDEYEQFFE